MLSVYCFRLSVGFFPPFWCVFTLFYGIVEISCGHGSILKLSELKNVVWGFGVLKSGGYFVLVHAFIGGFQFSSYVAWIGRKNLFYRACVLVFEQWFKHKLAGFILP